MAQLRVIATVHKREFAEAGEAVNA
jgi:hypothetical protein